MTMTNQRMLFPDPAMQIGDNEGLRSKRYVKLTLSMNPQQRSDRDPVLEYGAFEEPCGCSLVLVLASDVVICGWVRRRKPFVNVLFDLCPWAEDSVSTTDGIWVGDHKHFTSSTTFFTSTTPHLTSTTSPFTSPTSCLTSTTSRLTSTTSRLTSPMSLDICCTARLVFSAPTRTCVQCDVQVGN